MGTHGGEVQVLEERRSVTRPSLRDLARRPLKERHRVLRNAQITVDPDETRAWDTTLADLPHWP